MVIVGSTGFLFSGLDGALGNTILSLILEAHGLAQA